MHMVVRDTEEEAIQVLRNIVGRADTDSTLDGGIWVNRLRMFSTGAEDAPHRSRPVSRWLQITANRYFSTGG